MRDGTPDFRVVDARNMEAAVTRRLCGLSGDRIRRRDGAWLIGGPLSAFSPRGAYLDPPMLPDCAEYALRTCPFLALPRYVEKAFREKGGGFDGMIVEHAAAQSGRPDVFVAVHCDDWECFAAGGSLLFRPVLPYRSVSFWRNGTMVTHAEARGLSRDVPEAGMLPLFTRSVTEPAPAH